MVCHLIFGTHRPVFDCFCPKFIIFDPTPLNVFFMFEDFPLFIKKEPFLWVIVTNQPNTVAFDVVYLRGLHWVNTQSLYDFPRWVNQGTCILHSYRSVSKSSFLENRECKTQSLGQKNHFKHFLKACVYTYTTWEQCPQCKSVPNQGSTNNTAVQM